MASLMLVDVVSSEERIFSGKAQYIIAPALMGEIGIYPHHVPLISKLRAGVLRLQVPEQAEQIVLAISGGFIEIQNNHVTVLADVVERTTELDEIKLLEQKKQAEARIKHAGATISEDVAKAYASLEIAIAQLKALEYIKKQSKRS
jgi:F-type H+-transporting ATPase subunit epsilon